MIKPIHKFNINKTLNFSILTKMKKGSEQIPKVDKPIIAYMSDLFFEQERNNSLNSFFESDNSLEYLYAFLSKKNDVKNTDNESKNEFKSETKIEVKSDVKEEVKTETKTKNITLEKEITKTKESVQQVQKSLYSSYAEPKVILKTNKLKELINDIKYTTSKIFNGTNKIVSNIFYSISNKIEDIKQEQAYKKQIKVMKKERLEAEAARIEAKAVSSARFEFAQLHQKYISMFAKGDLFPNVPEFNNYYNLNSIELKKLIFVIKTCIQHQAIINSLRPKFCIGADKYSEDNDKQAFRTVNLQEISPKQYILNNKKRSENFKKELVRIYKIYIENSKAVENPISAFNNVTKTFFDKSKKSLKEIYDIKKKWYYRYLEKVPKLGLIPRAVRVAGQINLTRCIMKDYKDVTNNYVKLGLSPVMKKYTGQAALIKDFVNKNKYYLERDDFVFAEQTLQNIENVKTQRLNAYKKLFDLFAKGGCNISNICTNIRLRESIGLLKKAAVTFLSVF